MTEDIDRQTQAYEDQLRVIRQIAEADSIRARLQAERDGHEDDVAKEELRTQLAWGKINEYDYGRKIDAAPPPPKTQPPPSRKPPENRPPK